MLPNFESLQGGQGYSGLASELGIGHLTTLLAQKPTELLLKIRHAWDSESGEFSHVGYFQGFCSGILLALIANMGDSGIVFHKVWVVDALILNRGMA